MVAYLEGDPLLCPVPAVNAAPRLAAVQETLLVVAFVEEVRGGGLVLTRLFKIVEQGSRHMSVGKA